MSKAGESFDEVWEKLKAENKTGTFEKAEVLSFISCEALEYAYNSGYTTAKAEFERPQGEWICIMEGDLGINTYKCSLCGHRITCTEGAMKQHKGCYCGAAMKGGAE